MHCCVVSIRPTISDHDRRRRGRGEVDVADLAGSRPRALTEVDPPVGEVEVQCHGGPRDIDHRERQSVVLRVEAKAAHGALSGVDEVIVPRHHAALVVRCEVPKGAAAFLVLTAGP